jgi:hypothetical protein
VCILASGVYVQVASQSDFLDGSFEIINQVKRQEIVGVLIRELKSQRYERP